MPKKKLPVAEPTLPLRREEKKMLTRQLVLAAALAEFRENGFDAASTAAIAQRAGVSHGAVFTVEPTKEKLAVAAFDGEVRSVGEQAFARAFGGGENVADRVMGIFSALFDFYGSHQLISRVLLREMLLSSQPGGGTPNDRLLNDYFVGLRVLVQSAASGQQLEAGIDAEAVASALLGIYLVFLLARLNEAYPDQGTHLGNCRRTVEAVLGPLTAGKKKKG